MLFILSVSIGRFLSLGSIRWLAKNGPNSSFRGDRIPSTSASRRHVAYNVSLRRFLRYVRDLRAYLEGFYRRTQPLVDIDELIDERLERFAKEWNAAGEGSCGKRELRGLQRDGIWLRGSS